MYYDHSSSNNHAPLHPKETSILTRANIFLYYSYQTYTVNTMAKIEARRSKRNSEHKLIGTIQYSILINTDIYGNHYQQTSNERGKDNTEQMKDIFNNTPLIV